MQIGISCLNSMDTNEEAGPVWIKALLPMDRQPRVKTVHARLSESIDGALTLKRAI